MASTAIGANEPMPGSFREQSIEILVETTLKIFRELIKLLKLKLTFAYSTVDGSPFFVVLEHF